MALSKTEAIILKSFNWSESSRTVVFFTRERGKWPLTDKGGRSFKSKRGRLHRLAKLEVTYYSSEKQSNGYISEVELLHAYSYEAEGSLGRITFASAACESLYLLLPEDEAHPELFDYLTGYLATLELADKSALPSVFITFFLRLLSRLGYHPSLGYCAGCGKELKETAFSESAVLFSPERGGIICDTCQRASDDYIRISAESYALLRKLETASLKEAAASPIGFSETVQLIDGLSKFVSYQTGLKPELKSLEFLEKLKNSDFLK